jgi:predicted transcriptional regulator
MPLSVRLKPELEHLLDAAARRERKSRSAIIHEALAVRLRPVKLRLGDAIREALAEASDGFALDRKQPRKADRRTWGR